jgi:hypothetical protein
VEHRLRVFENRVLRRMFGPNVDGVAGGYNEELHKVYSLSAIIRMAK